MRTMATVASRSDPTPVRSATTRRAATIAVGVLALILLRAWTDVPGDPRHALHVLLRGLYFVPIVAGGVWFGVRGGVAAGMLGAVAYSLQIPLSWSLQPMENATQVAHAAVLIVAGVTAGALADAQERQRRLRRRAEHLAQREPIIQGIASLAQALRIRDAYTREHSERVATLAVAAAAELGLSAVRIENVRLAALMHDIGKIGVPDDILYKMEELSPDERAAVRLHPWLAAQVLLPIRGASRIAEVVLCHHECPDGTGYPWGLRETQIPLEAHVIRVADVLSALTDRRSYKEGMSADVAFAIMRDMAPRKLHGPSLAALERALEKTGALVGARRGVASRAGPVATAALAGMEAVRP